MKILQNVLLKDYTTFKIGGPAKYFFIARSSQDLIKAVEFAKDKQLPYFILGGGSNLLVSDEGFEGPVIKLQNSEFKVRDSQLMAEAGTPLGKLVGFSIEKGLTGLENLAGIPGTIAGAVRGNAGAFGHSISELVKQVTALNQKLQTVIYQSADCKFGYRESIFKHNSDIILSVELQLKRGNKEKSQQIIREYLGQRKNKQPLSYASAGCIFKNLPEQSAGYLIDQAGLKGKKIGQAMISEKHANFIVNLGNAKAGEVKQLIDLIKKTVKQKFKIDLEEEVGYLGLQ